MMRKKYSDFSSLLFIISMVLALGFVNPAWAAPPEIYSITPDTGSNKGPTQVTINGSGFQPTPKVALYGGGPYITGACDTPGDARGVHVTGTYAYVADDDSGLQVIEKFSPLPDIQHVDSGTLIATVPPGYRLGAYNLHVTNPDGGHAVLHNAFTSQVEVTMELPEGWSMISLPVRPEVATVTTLFPEAVVVYKYQRGTGYVEVTVGENLEVSMGYWILLNNPQIYIIRGTAITEYTMPVVDGWYMIGGCSSPAQKMVTSGKIDVIYGYTQGKGLYSGSWITTIGTGKGILDFI